MFLLVSSTELDSIPNSAREESTRYLSCHTLLPTFHRQCLPLCVTQNSMAALRPDTGLLTRPPLIKALYSRPCKRSASPWSPRPSLALLYTQLSRSKGRIHTVSLLSHSLPYHPPTDVPPPLVPHRNSMSTSLASALKCSPVTWRGSQCDFHPSSFKLCSSKSDRSFLVATILS